MPAPSELAGRIFIAAPLEASARDAIAAHLHRSLGPDLFPGRRVAPESWHLTLRFLGDTTRTALGVVIAGLRDTDLGPPFRLAFTDLGAFPSAARAKVVWLGTGDGADRLRSLAAHCEAAALAAGFEPETRPFKAHLTLSRLRPERDVTRWLAKVPTADIATDVAEVVVVRSHLGPAGARYENVERFPLAGPPSRRRPSAPERPRHEETPHAEP